MPQLVSSQLVDNQNMVEGAITGNGKYHAYISPELSANNNKAMDASLQIQSFLPNRQSLGKALCTLVMERKDDSGNWHPIHALRSPVAAIEFDDTENGGIIPEQEMQYGPNIFSLDLSLAIDESDGVNIIARKHQAQGVMPAKFRFCVIVHERDFGNVGAFQSITFSLDYELRAE